MSVFSTRAGLTTISTGRSKFGCVVADTGPRKTLYIIDSKGRVSSKKRLDKGATVVGGNANGIIVQETSTVHGSGSEWNPGSTDHPEYRDVDESTLYWDDHVAIVARKGHKSQVEFCDREFSQIVLDPQRSRYFVLNPRGDVPLSIHPFGKPVTAVRLVGKVGERILARSGDLSSAVCGEGDLAVTVDMSETEYRTFDGLRLRAQTLSAEETLSTSYVLIAKINGHSQVEGLVAIEVKVAQSFRRTVRESLSSFDGGRCLLFALDGQCVFIELGKLPTD